MALVPPRSVATTRPPWCPKQRQQVRSPSSSVTYHGSVAKGYNQVLWLFGEEQEITEVGTMNLFVFWINENGEKELVTPPLDGTILPGVTRQSILDMAREVCTTARML